MPSDKIEALLDFIKDIKGPAARTNAVIMPSLLETFIKEHEGQIIVGKDVAVISIPDTENILRIQFFARSPEALKTLHELIPLTKRQIICEIVGRAPKVGSLAKELEEAGFSYYAKFQRMLCKTPQPDLTLDISEVEAACPEDAKEILDITRAVFDPLTARIPSLNSLIRRIEEGEVFVIRRAGQIAGFTSFDSKHKRVALLDHVIVRPEYRNQKIAKKILTYKWLMENESLHYILWINELCDGPIRYHKKNGFVCDGIYDYIFTIRKEH